MSMVGVHCEIRCSVADNTSSVSGAAFCDAAVVPLHIMATAIATVSAVLVLLMLLPCVAVIVATSANTVFCRVLTFP
jgi:hypothetical protein